MSLNWFNISKEQAIQARRKLKNEVKKCFSPNFPISKLNKLYLYVTRGCNLDCSYCWVGAGIPEENELTLEEIHEIIDESYGLGVRQIKITGGEPFYRDDILDIIEAANRKNITLDVETNGTLIKEKQFMSLRNLTNIHFLVTLDGHIKSIHESTRRENGSFEATIKCMKLLGNNAIPFSVITVTNKYNAQFLTDIQKFSFELGAVSHRAILTLQPIGRGVEAKEICLDFEDIVQLISNMYNFKRKENKVLSIGTAHSTLPPALQPFNDLELTSCGWGWELCGILSNGDVSVCGAAYESLKLVAGNIREESLRKIWEESDFFHFLRSISPSELKGICGNCIVAPTCRGLCRVNAYATYNNFRAPYPLCQEFYNRGKFPTYAMENPEIDCTYIENNNK